MGHLCVLSSDGAKMIWEVHYSQVPGNFRVEKIVLVLYKYFYWMKLRKDVSKYLRSCTSCSIAKETIQKQGMYTHLATLDMTWKSILMDYMQGIPSTKHGNDCVFMVVDRFSKMSILTTCSRVSQLNPLPSSSLSMCAYIFESHRP